MKESSTKRSRWLSIALIITLLTLLSFTVLPLVNAIVELNRPVQSTSGGVSDTAKQLELQAQGYQVVLDREPNNIIALRGLLEVRLAQGDLQGAIPPLDKLGELNPEKIEYKLLLAETKEHLKDYEGAIATYQAILKNHPFTLSALQKLTSILLEQNRPTEAINIAQQTWEKAQTASKSQSESLDPVPFQLMLGQIYALEERYSEAIAIYDQAILAKTDDFRPILSKALVLQVQEKYSEAKPLFEQTLAKAPEDYQSKIREMAAPTYKTQSATPGP